MTITCLFNRILEEIALVLFLACPISISVMVHDKFLMLFAYYLADLLPNSRGKSSGGWQSFESSWLSLLWKGIILCELCFTLCKTCVMSAAWYLILHLPENQSSGHQGIFEQLHCSSVQGEASVAQKVQPGVGGTLNGCSSRRICCWERRSLSDAGVHV